MANLFYPVYPPVRTLIGQAMTLPIPELIGGYSYDEVRYPLNHLVDKTSKTIWRSLDRNIVLRFDLGTASDLDFVGIVGHNLTPGTLCSVHASTDPNTLNYPPYPPDDEWTPAWFEEQVLSRSFLSRQPNCWVDVRDVNGAPCHARYWQVHVHENGVPVSIGEIVMGSGAVMAHGSVKLPITEELEAKQSRQQTETGVTHISATGVVIRSTTLQFVLTMAEQQALRDFYASQWNVDDTTAPLAVVIPSTSVNDLWYIELPNLDVIEYPEALLEGEHQLEMTEEVFGVS